MANINKAAVLIPFSDLTAKEHSDRLTAIEAQVASSLATQKSEVAAAIAQVNLTQSQTVALTLEVNNLKTDLTNSITATQTDLINRADQLAQDVTDITVQLTQDKATFTQEIQDALDFLKDDASVASALRTPRKINGTDFDGRNDITTDTWGATRTFQIGNKTNSINGTSNVAYSLVDIGAFPDVGGTIQGNVEVTGNLSVGGTISATLEGTAARADKLQVARKIQGVDFDGTKDISLPTFTTETDGLVPKRVGATSTKYLCEDGSWVIPPNTTYSSLTKANAEAGTSTTDNVISAKVLKDAIQYHAPTVTNITGNAGTATKLQTARTIGGVSFDGTANINLPGVNTAGNQSTSGNAGSATKLATSRTLTVGRTGKAFDGSANVGWTATEVLPSATSGQFLKFDGTNWIAAADNDTTYSAMSQAEADTGTATSSRVITAAVLKSAIQTHAPVQSSVTGNAATATKLQTPRTINGVSFDGTQNISLPEYSLPTASASGLGGIKVGSGLDISNSVLSVSTLNQNTTGNAATASKLQTARTISLTGEVTGSISFDGSDNASISTAITGLGVANGIATLDSNGQVPSTQLPSFVGDVLEYSSVEAFPATGESGKIYVETTGNTTYRWGGTAYVKITSGEVLSVAGKVGVVTLSKADVGLANVDNTADSAKNVASASKLTTSRTIGGVPFNGTASINLPGVNIAGNQNTTGNAATATTATKLSTASGSALSYSARAWVNFNGTGTVTIRGSGNVSSIVDNGVGDYTVIFITAMQDANYCVTGASALNNSPNDANYNTASPGVNNLSTAAFRVATGYPGDSGNYGAAVDAEFVHLAVFR